MRAFDQPFGTGLDRGTAEPDGTGARIDAEMLPGCREPKIPNGDATKSMIGLLRMGKPDHDVIEAFRKVPFFRHTLGLGQCPASPTLRQRLDIVNGAFDQIVREESARLIRNATAEIGTVFASKGELVALDIDVSPCLLLGDTHFVISPPEGGGFKY